MQSFNDPTKSKVPICLRSFSLALQVIYALEFAPNRCLFYTTAIILLLCMLHCEQCWPTWTTTTCSDEHCIINAASFSVSLVMCKCAYCKTFGDNLLSLVIKLHDNIDFNLKLCLKQVNNTSDGERDPKNLDSDS